MDTSDSTTLKRCTKCGELKSCDQFSKGGRSKDGLRSQCKSCHAAYRTANRDSIREYNREYYALNADRLQEYRAARADKSREWNRANRDKKRQHGRKWYAANIEKVREYHRKYRAASSDMSRVRDQRRNARKHGLPNEFTATDWQHALAHFNGCCAVCGRQPGLWHTLAMDHWIPLTSPDCPGTVPWNIVPLCHGVDGCNNTKFNRDADEWLLDKFGPRKGKAILRRIEAFLDSRQR
jgi:hypothetical protein